MSEVASARTSRVRRFWGFMLASVLLATSVVTLGQASRASAAGPAVVSVVTTITDTAGTPIASVNAQTIPNGRYVVNVAYSCNVANCEGTTVTIPGPEVDSFYGTQRREVNAFTFNPPFTPAPPISGTAYTGLTVNLGTVVAGTSGSFSVEYTVDDRTLGGVAGGSFFLNGSLIQRSATISSATSDNPATATGTATWVSTVPNPRAFLTAPASTATNTDVTVSWLRSDSGCVTFDASFVEFRAASWLTCAASYSATVQLPPKAVYVPGSGGTYDAGTHSVTFAETGQVAARGIYGRPGSFRVQFPSTEYPTTSPGCIVTESFTGSQTVTYLENSVKTANAAPFNIQVGNCAPFGKANMSKGLWNANTNTFVGAVNIPTTPGGTLGGLRWQVTANNQGNVPGVATITDTTLDQPNLPVASVSAGGGTGSSTINYTLDNGTTGTATNSFTAPAGRRIVAVTATSGSLVGPNVEPGGTLGTPFTVAFNTSLTNGATPGQRCNTAGASVSYPAHPTVSTVTVTPVTSCVTLVDPSGQTALTASAPVATVTGGGTALVGSEVIWRANGSIGNLTAGSPLRPQYIFVAPLGWDIAANGASFTSSPPAGATFDYRTVTYDGTIRQAVVVNWATPLGQSGTVALPQLAVRTSPTLAAPAGTNNQTAAFLLGDVENSIATSFNPPRYNDTTDLDGDGSTTDAFARNTGATSLAASLGLGVVKEICRPDVAAADGCDWIADPDIRVGVPPTASSINYRVTVTNQGNTALADVNIYDVLPYIGDTGTSTATAATPRGSTVKEVLANVSGVAAGMTLAYSTSTNPPRPEVYSGATTGDWTAPLAGASSIRATIASIPFGGSRSFIYEAALQGGSADEIACNSVAASASLLAPIEPRAVCATTEEADLSIVADAHFPLQAGRPAVVPFTVENHGGSQAAPAEVTIDVPADVTILDLSEPGWECTAPATDGPTTVTCRPVQGDGIASRTLTLDTPETIDLSVRPQTDAANPLCFDGTVTGLMTDPDLANNTAESCSTVVAVPPEILVEKTDGVTAVPVGGETTYMLTATNRLVGEALAGVMLTDTLPAGVELVTSSPAASVSGSTLTWDLGALAAYGVEGTGSGTSGGAGSATSVSVTVRVLPGAMNAILNTAELTAPDPADASVTLAAQAADTDTVTNVFADLGATATTPQNTAVVTQLSAIVSTAGAPLSPTSVSQAVAPQHGSLLIDPITGAVTYTPTTGYSGPDSYEVQVCDTSSPAQCTTAGVDVTVLANTVDAVDDSATTTAEQPVTTTVLANDTSASGQALATTPTITAAAADGTTTVNVVGTITYTPDDAFSGADAYNYEVCDTSSPTPVCDTATVSVLVHNVFVDGPAAESNDGVDTPQNTPVTTPLDQIVSTLGAAVDPGTVTQGAAPRHGAIVIDPVTGAVTYTPLTGYAGTDTYEVSVCDTATPQECDSVIVEVTMPPALVVAVDDTVVTAPGVGVVTNVRANDTTGGPQPLGLPTITIAPTNGTATVNADGTITYTPAAGYSGTDTYSYEVCDTSFPVPSCDTAAVDVTIANVFIPGPATEGNVGVTTPQNTPVITPLADIVTTSGTPIDPTSVTQVTAPLHGTIAIDAATGAVTFTPQAGYSGPDTYEVNVCDTGTPPECADMTVAVTVLANVVTAVDDTGSTPAAQPVTTTVLANDTSQSGQAFALPTITVAATNGSAAVNAGGTITYTPNASFSGADSYSYEICDTSVPTPVCDTAMVDVTVVNVFVSGPAAQGNVGVETPHNTAVTTPLDDIVTTVGLPVDPASVTETTAPQHGTISIDAASGAVTFTPTPGYAGPDTYVVNACDTGTPPECSDVTVAVTVLTNTVSAPDLQVDTRTNEGAEPIDLLAGAVSASGQPFVEPPTISTQPEHGTVEVDAEGVATYTPDDLFDGEDTFVYEVCDTSTPTPVCDTGTVTVVVEPVADLTVTKDLVSEQIVAGLPVVYDVPLTNNGPSTATAVHSVDPIPAAILNPVGTPDSDIAGATCETRPTAAADLDLLAQEYGPYTLASHPLVVDCTYPQLPSGTTVHDTIAGTVDPALLAGTTVVNQVAVYSTAYDPAFGDNLAAASAVSIVTPPTPTPAALSRTGVAITGWAAGAALLLLVGAGVVMLSRRRRANQEG